nr:NucA/NucB deoxyribonuclease domain-containing protein [Streptomyces canus]
MKLTDNTSFTQLAVAKPGLATLQSADGSADLKEGVPSGQSSSAGTKPLATHGTYNGVNQTALAACMAQDPDHCPEVDQSARHILDAQQFPERTFPSWPGKSVPGADEPLHRLINTDQQQANRNQATKTCNDVWGDYSGTSLQCDEYPFASTKERGADNLRYSARLIDGSDNEEDGRRLNSMYTANRILDGDAFYVTIVP